MSRPKDRVSAKGLLPRMEARPWADGVTITYRFKPIDGKPVNLGTDRQAALQKVLDITGKSPEVGTINELWRLYKDGADWAGLGKRTKEDYENYSVHLLRVFGPTRAGLLTAPMVARYLRKERKEAPVHANREIALLGNLMSLAIERGEAEHNPCRGGQVKRNKERPRTVAPEPEDIAALVAHAAKKGGQWVIVCGAAEFSALAGSRQVEFLTAAWTQIGETEIRLKRAKQHDGKVKWERIAISPDMHNLLDRMRPLAHDDKVGTVFPNRYGNPYTYDGFQTMWQRLMREALNEGIVSQRFTFHDLRAYYTTQHKEITGDLPDLHASPTTTARIYERSKIARRKAL